MPIEVEAAAAACASVESRRIARAGRHERLFGPARPRVCREGVEIAPLRPDHQVMLHQSALLVAAIQVALT